VQRGVELGVVLHSLQPRLSSLFTRLLSPLLLGPRVSLPWAPASTSSMNSAERVGLKSICFESPGFHGTPSCIYRGQTLLLGRGLMLSSPPGPHAFSVYRAFCRASMSSVLFCPRACNRIRLGRGHSASQDYFPLPVLVPGPKPVPLLPFLHPEKIFRELTTHKLAALQTRPIS